MNTDQSRRVVTVLDDYQNVALKYADWSAVKDQFEVDVITQHIADVDELVERIRSSAVVVAMRERTPFPASTLERLPQLKLLVTTGNHNASIDFEAARRLGIVVSGTNAAKSTVPELVFGMILSLFRHIPAEYAAVQAGGWQHTIGRELRGSTLGIIGLGKQGIPVAAIAAAFEMNVIAWSPNLTEERAAQHGAKSVSKAELLEKSDVVTIHMPLSDRSRNLIGGEDLALMKPDAYLINTSRGPIVNEAALIAALSSGRIGGAALDVFDVEPLPTDHPLRKLDNALVLPHLGYVTAPNYAMFYEGIVEAIVGFAAGMPVRVI